MMAGPTLRSMALFLVVVCGQIGGSVLLGYTAGFTRPGWSVLCASVYAVSLFSLATLLKEGAPLSLMMPLLAAVVPLGSIAMALVVLGEPASWPRIALLSLSCVVVGLASLA
ncbi:DMT family transporter [Novosphingobium malaysiense]|uniref:EamA domain-containing protein n=1 Tax=Novosphingobium malaysiense TaxID=1348853 RepID=A0A0B1ZUA7_9SPHN|nr:hypothetical protein [Novosphingobium malaysiense]KHK93049.1 hypothetical protein LK12_01380 [Novosphingobium malaysiense]